MVKELNYFKVPGIQEPPLGVDADEAEQVIRLLKQGKDETRIVKENGISMPKVKEVIKEWRRAKNEFIYVISGKKVVTPEVPAEFDKEGKEITPAVEATYLVPTTKAQLEAALTPSPLFSFKDILSNILAYDNKTPYAPMTLLQLRNKYQPK